MEIKAFEGVNREELSMIEVAHAILEKRGDIIDFSDLVNQIQNYLGKSDSMIREELSQFYTDLNIDGSFISLGENRWGLRSWYPIDSIDEEVSNFQDDEDEDRPVRKKRKRVNAFIDSDEDAIDYNDDDPEDSDLTIDDDDDYIDDEDEDEEIAEYNKDLSELGADDISDDDDIPEGVEDELTIVDEDDLDSDLDYEDEEDEEEL
ncbi:DNA-directed RNA polymerase subunit delta [Vagococcus zengguangii]|uniref:Probable DNA-directed RNA polymerase subunit delta n=1 Tax=Vagococcus zengguangii TaxID=2571750 RepID=A0A4D7CYY9_9ENTE|nr:DNA-directed RNA polymerase subunit delta [Vagococcus zengguangii]QCI86846.1 DNA-directed RNA polymerase subunit delta [Vagococcus zengguangii]TLG80452.1 DNA-directed RNA polymerase subunit delta [Vagococcus zengguangii]